MKMAEKIHEVNLKKKKLELKDFQKEELAANEDESESEDDDQSIQMQMDII